MSSCFEIWIENFSRSKTTILVITGNADNEPALSSITSIKSQEKAYNRVQITSN